MSQLLKVPQFFHSKFLQLVQTFLTFNQTHYERNDLIGWIAFEVCNAKTYELFMVRMFTTLHPHIFMGAFITDRTIFTSDTKEFHFHKRDFDWLIRNFEHSWKRMQTIQQIYVKTDTD
jgi:hypothetical protein